MTTAERFLSRKFWVTMYVVTIVGVLAYVEKLAGEGVFTVAIGAYNLANVGVEWVRSKNGGNDDSDRRP